MGKAATGEAHSNGRKDMSSIATITTVPEVKSEIGPSKNSSSRFIIMNTSYDLTSSDSNLIEKNGKLETCGRANSGTGNRTLMPTSNNFVHADSERGPPPIASGTSTIPAAIVTDFRNNLITKPATPSDTTNINKAVVGRFRQTSLPQNNLNITGKNVSNS